MLFIFYSFPFGWNNFCLSGSHLLTHLPAPICRGVNFSFPILHFSISGLLTHSSLKSLFLCCSFLLIHYEHFSLKSFRIFFFLYLLQIPCADANILVIHTLVSIHYFFRNPGSYCPVSSHMSCNVFIVSQTL